MLQLKRTLVFIGMTTLLGHAQLVPQKIKWAFVGNSITYLGWNTLFMPSYVGPSFSGLNAGCNGCATQKSSESSWWTMKDQRIDYTDPNYPNRLSYLQMVRNFQPDIVSIDLAVNDTRIYWRVVGDPFFNDSNAINWHPATSPAAYERDLRALVDTMRNLASKPRVFLNLPLPAYSHLGGIQNDTLDKYMIPILKKVAAEMKCPLIDWNTKMKSASLPARKSMMCDGVHPSANSEAQANISCNNAYPNYTIPNPGSTWHSGHDSLAAWTFRDYLSSTNTKKVLTLGSTGGWKNSDTVMDVYPEWLGARLGKDYFVYNANATGQALGKASDNPVWNQARFKAGMKIGPDIAVIELGMFDSKSNNWQSQGGGIGFSNQYSALIDSLRAKNSVIKIYAVLPPMGSGVGIDPNVLRDSIVPSIRNVAINKNVQLIDLFAYFSNKPQLVLTGGDLTVAGHDSAAKLLATEIFKSGTVRMVYKKKYERKIFNSTDGAKKFSIDGRVYLPRRNVFSHKM